jgi:hypothetical protein
MEQSHWSRHHSFTRYFQCHYEGDLEQASSISFNSVDSYSCLSEYVSALVISADVDQYFDIPYTILHQEENILQWTDHSLIQYFTVMRKRDNNRKNLEDEDHRSIYRHIAQYVRQLSRKCHEILSQRGLTCLELIYRHSDLLKQLGLCIERHAYLFQNEHCVNNILLQFTVFSTFVERLISSAFKTVRIVKHGDKEDKVIIPSTLSEILLTDELTEIFEENIVDIIIAFMGKPTGLNLRNIVWHGFIEASGQLESYHVTFLVILYLSLCKRVVEWTKRENCGFFWKEQLEQNETYYECLYSEWMTHSFNISSTQFDIEIFSSNATQIINNSYFIPPPRKIVSLEIVKHFYLAVKSTSEKEQMRFLHNTLALLFPQIEHLLRIVYVSVNNVSENMLRAESKVLFSTLDILLNPLITSELAENDIKERSNKLGNVLGHEITDALLDIFIHYQGPRLRDKVAHNELASFNIFLVLHTLVLYLYIARKLSHIQEHSLLSPLLQKGFDYFKKGNTSLFDIRVRFIKQWNQFIKNERIFSEQDMQNLPSVKECNEYYSVFSKTGYVLKKINNEAYTPTSNTLIEEQFDPNIKLSKKDILQFTVEDLLIFLDRKLKNISCYMSTIDLRISENYRDHFFATEQHISNVEICKRILEGYLIPAREMLLNKLKEYSTPFFYFFCFY